MKKFAGKDKMLKTIIKAGLFGIILAVTTLLSLGATIYYTYPHIGPGPSVIIGLIIITIILYIALNHILPYLFKEDIEKYWEKHGENVEGNLD